MSFEEASVSRDSIEDLSPAEIQAIIFPALVAGEPLLPDDIEIIQARALVLAEEDDAHSPEDAILNAAGERFAARPKAGSQIVLDANDSVVVVAEGGTAQKAMRAAASLLGRNI